MGIFPVRSPLLGESLTCFLFLEVLRWFTSLRSPSHTYVFSVESPESLPAGLPHSDICGSKPARDSPQLFAACHVLLRLWMPRHPPYALSSLTINLFEKLKRLKSSKNSKSSRTPLNSIRTHRFCVRCALSATSVLCPSIQFSKNSSPATDTIPLGIGSGDCLQQGDAVSGALIMISLWSEMSRKF